MNRKMKMVAFDLDGTLLDSNKRISDRTKEAMRKAIEAGAVLLPATGRPLTGIPKELLEFPGIQYAVTANGARVVDVKTGEVVFGSMIPVDVALRILENYEKYDCHVEVFLEGASYGNKACQSRMSDFHRHPSMVEYTLKTRIFVDSVKEKLLESNAPLEKIQAFFVKDEDMEAARKELELIPEIVFATSLGNNWEVNLKGTDKGNALIELGKILGIEKEEIMACGDGMNDYEMIRKVGFGVVMENGDEELKNIAKHITVSNDKNGVAKAIEEFVLGGEDEC